MAFREVRVIEGLEVLRCWLAGAGLRTVAERPGWTASPPAGLSRLPRPPAWSVTADRAVDRLSGRGSGRYGPPARASGHGAAWELLVPQRSGSVSGSSVIGCG